VVVKAQKKLPQLVGVVPVWTMAGWLICPITGIAISAYTAAMIIVFLIVLLFFLGGYTWQALDTETFPDESLPRWFVRLFR
jgi:hypothetical protein